jgi:hypothetical protein
MDDESPIRLEHPDWQPGSADPQAVTEQPDLAFEHKAESRWIGDPMGLRMVAVTLTHFKRGKAGRAKIPWLGISVTAGVAVAGLLVVVGLLALLFPNGS